MRPNSSLRDAFFAHVRHQMAPLMKGGKAIGKMTSNILVGVAKEQGGVSRSPCPRGHRVSATGHFAAHVHNGNPAEFDQDVCSMRRVMKALQLLVVLLVLLTSYGICGVLPASVNTGSAVGPEPDPLAVVQALMDAEHVANLYAAMALFAADAFILNVTGWKTANREELTWFINTEIWTREDYALNHHRVSGDRVTWDEAAAESFYQDIGVAPVQFVFEATIRSGKIKSIIAHLPASEIDRISKACRAQAEEPLIHGRSCSEFVQLVEAHTKRHSGAARAQ